VALKEIADFELIETVVINAFDPLLVGGIKGKRPSKTINKTISKARAF
jgi:hypothetical protein